MAAARIPLIYLSIVLAAGGLAPIAFAHADHAHHGLSDMHNESSESRDVRVNAGLSLANKTDSDHAHAPEDNSGVRTDVSLATVYQVSDDFGLGLNAGYSNIEGISDPGIAALMAADLSDEAEGELSISVKAPASKESRDLNKTGAVSIELGPTVQVGSWTLSVKAQAGRSFYRQQKDEHDGEELSLAEHDEDDGGHIQHVEEGHAHEIEQGRTGGSAAVGYSFTTKLRSEVDVAATKVEHSDTDPTWQNDVTINRLVFAYGKVTNALSFGYTSEDARPRMPREAVGKLSVLYSF